MKIIIGNHKNYMFTNDVSEYLKEIDTNKGNVIICPSSIYLPYFMKKGFKIGIQNISPRSDIVLTGEISAKQAISMGINYSIIGHSERRINFNETNLEINSKIIDAISYGMKVILCVGETLEEKNMLKTSKVLKKQLRECLKDVNDFKNIVIAYEPVWAIGTNKIPSNNDILKTIEYIKKTVKLIYNIENIKVLYGGSVSSNNINTLNQIENLDGILVGKASTDAKEFLKIIEVVNS